MSNLRKVIIFLLLASAVAAVVVFKKAENRSEQQAAANKSEITIHPHQTIRPQETANTPNKPLVMTIEAVEPVRKLPTLLELGADRCIPCRMMTPIIEELTKEYADRLHVQFHDVWKYPSHTRQYGVRVIPTQIFLDPNGKELFRHQGFFSKEDILAKWKELGFDFYK